MPVDSFWEQTLGTYNAAVRGAARRSKAQAGQMRDAALLACYFAGAGGYLWTDGKKAPSWSEFHRRMTQPPQPTSAQDLLAYFEALAAEGAELTIGPVTEH